MAPSVKIRGIYSTALTRFFLEQGVEVASPSLPIADRFGTASFARTSMADVVIDDSDTGHGVRIKGLPSHTEHVTRLLVGELWDAVIRRPQSFDSSGFTEVEFPLLAKCTLDEWRHRVVPTVFHHHRFKLIASDFVDLVEQKDLFGHPERREPISRNLESKLIWESYRLDQEIAIEHVKLDGRTIFLSEGRIRDIQKRDGTLVLERKRFKGRSTYDGLELSKSPGDYAVSVVTAGSWHYQHTYCRKNGKVIGHYGNINTPVEFYPGKIRYVDLEVDVVRRPEGRPRIIDQETLERRQREGYITKALKDTAMARAQEVLAQWETW